jgi:hypothetical protein
LKLTAAAETEFGGRLMAESKVNEVGPARAFGRDNDCNRLSDRQLSFLDFRRRRGANRLATLILSQACEEAGRRSRDLLDEQNPNHLVAALHWAEARGKGDCMLFSPPFSDII